MAESRGKIPLPETVEGQEVRDIIGKTFNLLESVPGTEVNVKGIQAKSNPEGDGTMTFKLNNRQQRRLAEKVQRMRDG